LGVQGFLHAAAAGNPVPRVNQKQKWRRGHHLVRGAKPVTFLKRQ
jgi:hypothetical protein